MSLFDRILEQHLRPGRPPAQTFAQKREQWLQEARAKAERGEKLPPVEIIRERNREKPTNPIQAIAPRPLTLPPPAPLDLSGPLVARGSCKAIDAETGRQCRLPAHPHAPDQHRSERGPFHRLAAPGQTQFKRRAELDALASSRSTSPFTTPQGD